MKCKICSIPEEIAGKPFSWMITRVFDTQPGVEQSFICSKCAEVTGDREIGEREAREWQKGR